MIRGKGRGTTRLGKVLACSFGKFRRSTCPDRLFVGESLSSQCTFLSNTVWKKWTKFRWCLVPFSTIQFILFFERSIIFFKFLFFFFFFILQRKCFRHFSAFVSFFFFLNRASRARLNLKFLSTARCFIDDRARANRDDVGAATERHIRLMYHPVGNYYSRLFPFIAAVARWLFARLTRKIRICEKQGGGTREKSALHAVDFRQKDRFG